MANQSNKAKNEHWFLLRGMVRESGHWGEFSERFREAVSPAEVHFLELPGTGKYFKSPSPATVDEMATFVRGQWLKIHDSLKTFGHTEVKSYLVAMSLGGMIGSRLIITYPKDFQGACFINTSLPGYSPMLHRLKPSALAKFVRYAAARNHQEKERVIWQLVSTKPPDEKILSHWAQINAERPIAIKVGMQQLRAAATCPSPRERPECPVLLLNSLGDHLVDPRCSVALHSNWKTALETHPFAGHDIALDDPDWVVEKIVNWRKAISD